MTADRPATEPRTEAGRALRDILHIYTGSKAAQQAIVARILRIEAEAAQGAAPRWADLRRCFYCNEKGTHAPQCDHPEGAAPRAEGLDVDNVADLLSDYEGGAIEWGAVMDGIGIEYGPDGRYRLSRSSDERVR